MSKFWAEDISQLFKLTDGLFPKTDQPLTVNLNAITRLSVILCVLIALFKPVLAVGTMCTCIITILAIYYGVSEKPVEQFKNFPLETIGLADELFKPSITTPVSIKRFCNDLRPIQFDEEYISQNQLLVGRPNPKTLRPPIVAIPSHQLSEWKSSDLTVHSAVNTATNFDAYASGYIGDGFNFEKGYSGYVAYSNSSAPTICSECVRAPCVCDKAISRADQLTTQTLQPGLYQQSDFTEPINSLIGISLQKQFDPMRITNTGSSVKYSAIPPITVRPHRVDTVTVNSIDTMINDERLEPSIERFADQKDRFPPLLQTESDVYDPRFTGYGPPDRGYIDPVTGQPRFFYDDINAVTMPNFISRNNVDIYPWAAQYGSGYNGNLSDGNSPGECPVGFGDGYKRLAANAFSAATIKFINEMQERLMRKRNAEMWQLRSAPIYTTT